MKRRGARRTGVGPGAPDSTSCRPLNFRPFRGYHAGPMKSRAQIAQSAAAGLNRFARRAPSTRVVVGFDGFVDSIIDVVDKRHSLEAYDPIRTIDGLGRKLLAAAGQSSNYELVTKLEKLGGNGPIMANATARAGLPTTYIGALGSPAIHRVFEPLSRIAQCISICNPGLTDALEFSDGKIMLGKHASLKDINAAQLDRVVGLEKLKCIVAPCRLLGMVNWTMLTKTDEIWAYLIERVFPGLPQPPEGRRFVFIDLADPEKRTRQDLAKALESSRRFQQVADVILGYNLKEAVQVAEVLGVEAGADPEAEIEVIAVGLRERLNVHGVVIHPRASAAAAVRTGQSVASGTFQGPLVKQPKLSTGAGDNFNSGFCIGMLAGLAVEEALCAGTGSSGYYVRNAESPSLDQLAAFCEKLPEPEL